MAKRQREEREKIEARERHMKKPKSSNGSAKKYRAVVNPKGSNSDTKQTQHYERRNYYLGLSMRNSSNQEPKNLNALKEFTT